MGKEYLPLPLRKDMESDEKMILSLQAVTIRLQVQNMGYRERTASGLLMVLIRLYPEKMGYMEKIPRTVV